MEELAYHFVVVHAGFAFIATFLCPLANALGLIGGPDDPSALLFMILCALLLKWFS